MKRPRTILLIGVGVVVVVVATVAVAAALIPSDRVARAVAARAEATLGQPVRIAEVGLRILPLPGVRLSGLAVGDSTPLARVDAVELRARILPLFRGQVVIDRLTLDRPRVLLEVDSAGNLNLPIARSDTPGPSGGRDVAFAISGIEVSDGRIGYRDTRDGTIVRLDGWRQSLRLAGSVRAGEIETVSLTGEVGFDAVDARLPDVVLPVRGLRLRVDHDATLDRAADRLDVRALEVTLNGISLRGSGSIQGVSSPERIAELDLAAEGLEAAELLAWVPDPVRQRLALPDGRPIRLTGRAALEATVRGPLAADTLPELRGTFVLSDVAAMAGDDALLTGIGARGSFSLDSVAASLEGRMLGEELSAEMAVGSPAAPVMTAEIQGRADLARLTDLDLVPDTLELGGAVAVDIRGRVPLDSPDRAGLAGTIDLAGLRVAGSDPSVFVAEGIVRLEGGRAGIRPLRVELGPGRDPVELEVTADGWIPSMLDSLAPPPTVVIALDADTLDLDRLLGPSESGYAPLLFARLQGRNLDGRSAEAVAEEQGLSLPAVPNVDANVEASVGVLVRNGLHYRDVEASLRVGPRAIDVDRLRFGLLGGTVEASGRLEPAAFDSTGAPAESRLLGQYTLSDLGAGPFFDRLTPFQDHLDGALDLAGSLDLVLDRHALPVRSSVGADGTIALADGRLSNWPVLGAVAGRLGLAAFDTIRFRDWIGAFRVAGPLVMLDETMLRGERLDVRAAGSFDLAGILNLGATLYLSTPLAERAGAVGREVVAAAGPDGRVPVGLRITGDVQRPDVALDLSEARSALVARAREAAEAAVEEQAGRLADRATREVAQRFDLPDSLRGLPAGSLRAVLGDSLFSLLPDSLKVPGDSLRTRAEDEIRARLQRLLRGGGGGTR
jgi:hypothetical protein